MESFGADAPEGLTILNASLYLKFGKNEFLGNIVAFGEKSKKIVARNLWIERMMEYAITAPPHTVVWLEQGVFYYLDDFEIILPPFSVHCGNISESYNSSSEVIGMTKAEKTYDQLIHESWRLTAKDFSYRQDSDYSFQ